MLKFDIHFHVSVKTVELQVKGSSYIIIIGREETQRYLAGNEFGHATNKVGLVLGYYISFFIINSNNSGV